MRVTNGNNNRSGNGNSNGQWTNNPTVLYLHTTFVFTYTNLHTYMRSFPLKQIFEYENINSSEWSDTCMCSSKPVLFRWFSNRLPRARFEFHSKHSELCSLGGENELFERKSFISIRNRLLSIVRMNWITWNESHSQYLAFIQASSSNPIQLTFNAFKVLCCCHLFIL